MLIFYIFYLEHLQPFKKFFKLPVHNSVHYTDSTRKNF